MEYIAHRSDDGRTQSIKEHLEGTAKRSGDNAVMWLKPYAVLAGLIHDIGKYTKDFQRRIRNEKIRVEHAFYGAELIDDRDESYITMLQYCIAGHHSGLPDGGTEADLPESATLNGILKRKAEEYSAYKSDVSVLYPEDKLIGVLGECKTPEELIEVYAFLTRYLYSCLTDADYIDTEQFCNPGTKRGLEGDFKKAYERVCEYMDSFKPETELQKERAKLQEQVYRNMEKKSDIYFLDMPTGSGKTLCSIRAALKKAIDEEKKRIIYVIPYTSIIEQTADNFEKIFGDVLTVLQHHSNYTFDDKSSDENESTSEKLRRCCENWDARLIITTNVQFFESFYLNRSSRLRKLHNIADSVIVFDEAHMLPINYIRPCLTAMAHAAKYLNSTVIAMSATMPGYKKYINMFSGGLKAKDLTEDDKSGYEKFKKCRFEYLGRTEWEDLQKKISECENALVVVNKKVDARSLYNAVKDMPGIKAYHLSTYMMPVDRLAVINKIKQSLSAGERVVTISTSLIEAGVDLDFKNVFRELNGLDSILQTAGRCNREGKLEYGRVYVFETEVNSNGGGVEQKSIARNILSRNTDLYSQECIAEYFGELYASKNNEIMNASICKCEGISMDLNGIPFRKYAEEFKLIDDRNIGIVIPCEDNAELIDSLEYGGLSVRRKLRKYTASVNRQEFEKLLTEGLIDETGGVFVLKSEWSYRSDIGIILDNEINCVM